MASNSEENPYNLYYFPKYQPKLHQTITNLLNKEQFSDAILKCENCEINVHRFLLSAKSEYFYEAFQDSDHGEIVQIDNIKLIDLKNVLSYIYNGHILLKQSGVESFMVAAEILKVPLDKRFYSLNDAKEVTIPKPDKKNSVTNNNQKAHGAKPEKLVPQVWPNDDDDWTNSLESTDNIADFAQILLNVQNCATKQLNSSITNADAEKLKQFQNIDAKVKCILRKQKNQHLYRSFALFKQIADRTLELRQLKLAQIENKQRRRPYRINLLSEKLLIDLENVRDVDKHQLSTEMQKIEILNSILNIFQEDNIQNDQKSVSHVDDENQPSTSTMIELNAFDQIQIQKINLLISQIDEMIYELTQQNIINSVDVLSDPLFAVRKTLELIKKINDKQQTSILSKTDIDQLRGILSTVKVNLLVREKTLSQARQNKRLSSQSMDNIKKDYKIHEQLIELLTMMLKIYNHNSVQHRAKKIAKNQENCPPTGPTGDGQDIIQTLEKLAFKQCKTSLIPVEVCTVRKLLSNAQEKRKLIQESLDEAIEYGIKDDMPNAFKKIQSNHKYHMHIIEFCFILLRMQKLRNENFEIKEAKMQNYSNLLEMNIRSIKKHQKNM